MAAAGIGNPVGAVQILDGGVPKTITGYVFKTVISGGTLCYASGAADSISSGTNSFATTDMTFLPDASGCLFNGVALHDAASGTPISIATEGTFILQCIEAVVAGTLVGCDGNNSVYTISNNAESGGIGGLYVIGRALTEATSGGYAIVHIRA